MVGRLLLLLLGFGRVAVVVDGRRAIESIGHLATASTSSTISNIVAPQIRVVVGIGMNAEAAVAWLRINGNARRRWLFN